MIQTSGPKQPIPDSQLNFIFVGDEHPHPLHIETDINSRGASYILENQLIKKDTCLVLEFLCEDKGHQEIVDGFLLGVEGFQKKLQEVLYGKNLLRGYPECKNISFFALI